MSGLVSTIRQQLGFRGAQNLAAWGFAGALAYYLWVRPERKAEEERRAARERARRFVEENGPQDVTRIKAIPDPQIGGLTKGGR